MQQIRISAKNLGQIALDSFCPKCFWIKLHTGFKLPYQIFPGIFSSIDSYSKKITNLYYEKHGSLLEWFDGFNLSRPIKSPSLRNFHTVIPETNIKLTGIPDEMFLKDDGSYLIADYKTARFTEHQDELLPMYEVQLNGYAYIAEQIGYGPVTGLVLVYYEPFTDISNLDVDHHVDSEYFSMNFYAHVLKIERNNKLLTPLLQKARQIYDMSVPPHSRTGCKECKLLNILNNSLTGTIVSVTN